MSPNLRTPGTFMHSGRVGIGVGDSTLMRPCFGPQDACTYVHAYVSLREPYTQLYYAPGRSVCSRVGHALHRYGHGWAWTWTRARPFTRYRRRTRSAAGRTGTSSVPRSTLWPACWRRNCSRSAQCAATSLSTVHQTDSPANPYRALSLHQSPSIYNAHI